ncbi:MAG: efflux RND transporter periplasmic adaptor subunit, partial [Alphaproteobacteria bacterium]|nr:efflux RND transporter periplasmic adaptor subunit [Alphaproteobacteria bacterium]
MLKNLATLILLALVGVGGFFASREYFDGDKNAEEEVANATVDWAVAAPGRVEPESGEIRIGTGLLGRVEEVLVKVKDKVEKGELVVRLDDADARARLAAAEVAAEASRDVRESQLPSGREDLRKAEDALYSAERAVTGARIELDYALAAKRRGTGSAQALSNARQRLRDANNRLERERIAYVKAQSKANLPAPSNAESAFNKARADVRMAEALLDKTRVRAPISGTILQVNTNPGEVVAPRPELALIIVGDMSNLTVKAEVDASDIAKIKLGQKAFVRSTSFPGKDFSGSVSKIAPALSRPAIHPRGPRLPNDVEVLEVTVKIDG